MGKVLVTGASGFIGGHLASALLRRGHEVRCLVRPTSSLDRLRTLGVELAMGNVTDLDSIRRAVRGVDVVYNLAGLTCATRLQDLYRVNADGPGHVAQACAEQQEPPVHVLVSSVAAAGPAPRYRLRRECDPDFPVSHYGRSKLQGERAAARWSHRVPTTIVRPGVVFGEYDPGMTPVLQTVYRFRAHVNAGLFSPLLSLIHVGDLTELLIQAAAKGERLPAAMPGNGQAELGDTQGNGRGQGKYFGVVPEYLRYEELGRMVAPALIGRGRPVTIYLPSLLAWIVAGGNEIVSRLKGRAELLNTDKIREALVSSWACSAEKIQCHFGFRPAEPLAARLQSTALWYRQQGWL